MTTPIAMRASAVLVAVDARTRDHADAEHLLHLLDDLLPADDPTYLASTHAVDTGDGVHTAVVASWTGAAPDASRLHGRLAGALATDVAVVVDRPPQVAGPTSLVAGARAAADQHSARSAGRLARFAGRADIERPCTVADVLALAAVDDVEALAGTELVPGTALNLSEWARPTWRSGRAVLVVQPARNGMVPFESRHQIPCCADH
ncbi:hypothetical protein [Nocardioides sp. SYSU DS0663]|uniref:hypothetical protein n=1 Tax=Nocardioides sp. SYSU DS0663 TaxID=3416445 RepID=UPI003F4B33A1